MSHQERFNVNFQLFGNIKCYRHSQQNCRDIVQKRRTNCGQQTQRHQKLYRLSFDFFCRPNRKKIKKPRFACDVHNYHHAHQKSERVKVNVVNCGLLRNNSQQNHQHRAENSDYRPVNFFGDYQRVGDNKNYHRHRCHVH